MPNRRKPLLTDEMRRLLKALTEARERLGLRQTDLAEQVGVTASVINRLEAGGTEAPAFRDLVCIGKVLGFTPNDLARIAALYPADTDVARDPRSYQLDTLLSRLPAAHREELLNTVVALAQSRVLAFGETDPPGEDPPATADGSLSYYRVRT